MRAVRDDDGPDFNGFSQSADTRAYFNHIWEAVFEGRCEASCCSRSHTRRTSVPLSMPSDEETPQASFFCRSLGCSIWVQAR